MALGKGIIVLIALLYIGSAVANDTESDVEATESPLDSNLVEEVVIIEVVEVPEEGQAGDKSNGVYGEVEASGVQDDADVSSTYELDSVVYMCITWLVSFPPTHTRLSSSSAASTGTVQLSHNGQWANICPQYFSYREADVACRELGYPGGANRYTSVPSSSSAVLQWVQCHGDEDGLGECQIGPLADACFNDESQKTIELHCNSEGSVSNFSSCLVWKLFLGLFLVSFIVMMGLHLHTQSQLKAQRALEKSKVINHQFMEPTFVVVSQQKFDSSLPPKQ